MNELTYGHKAVKHKAEQAVLATIKKLRKAGESYQSIANHLNDKRISYRGSRLWTKVVIMRVLSRL